MYRTIEFPTPARLVRGFLLAERLLAELQAVPGSKLIAKALYRDVESFAVFLKERGPGAYKAVADMLSRKRDVIRRNGYFNTWEKVRHAIDDTRCCHTCGKTKSASLFKVGVRHGLRTNLCRDCDTLNYRARRAANPKRFSELERRRHQANLDARRAAARLRAATPAGRASNRLAVQRYRERHPDREAAHYALSVAVRRGEVARPSICQAVGCNAPPVHAHHHDYSRPLAVTWLCRNHHEHVHHNGPLELKPGAERKFARAPKEATPSASANIAFPKIANATA